MAWLKAKFACIWWSNIYIFKSIIESLRFSCIVEAVNLAALDGWGRVFNALGVNKVDVILPYNNETNFFPCDTLPHMNNDSVRFVDK